MSFKLFLSKLMEAIALTILVASVALVLFVISGGAHAQPPQMPQMPPPPMVNPGQSTYTWAPPPASQAPVRRSYGSYGYGEEWYWGPIQETPELITTHPGYGRGRY